MVKSDDGQGAAAFVRTLPGRLWKALKWRIIITLIIAIGLIVHLVLVYNAASSLEVEGVTITSVYPESLEGIYTMTFTIFVDNPTSTTIEVDRLTYEIHLEEDFLGKGEKSFFDIPSGQTELDFSVTFSIYDLAGPTLTLFTEATATLKVSGEVTVPAKVFGLWTYTHLTLPYSHSEEVSSGGGPGPDPPPRQVLLAPAIYRPTASAELSWTQNTDADFARYEVHTSTTPNFTPSEATLAGTVNNQITTAYTVGSLSHLTTHHFRVRVFDLAGQHTDSNVQSLFVP